MAISSIELEPKSRTIPTGVGRTSKGGVLASQLIYRTIPTGVGRTPTFSTSYMLILSRTIPTGVGRTTVDGDGSHRARRCADHPHGRGEEL